MREHTRSSNPNISNVGHGDRAISVAVFNGEVGRPRARARTSSIGRPSRTQLPLAPITPPLRVRVRALPVERASVNSDPTPPPSSRPQQAHPHSPTSSPKSPSSPPSSSHPCSPPPSPHQPPSARSHSSTPRAATRLPPHQHQHQQKRRRQRREKRSPRGSARAGAPAPSSTRAWESRGSRCARLGASRVAGR